MKMKMKLFNKTDIDKNINTREELIERIKIVLKIMSLLQTYTYDWRSYSYHHTKWFWVK